LLVAKSTLVLDGISCIKQIKETNLKHTENSKFSLTSFYIYIWRKCGDENVHGFDLHNIYVPKWLVLGLVSVN